MRKGAKRKATKKEDAESPEKENHKKSTTGTAATRAKRVKASKPDSLPEYFVDKEDLWKDAFPVGWVPYIPLEDRNSRVDRLKSKYLS